ncbi:unnamed protein product [Brassicogethes aeneus]|nr:unnamed protein product [Brassicogethes aeneus]
MATQHQTSGGYRGWNSVGAGHQHPAAAAVAAAAAAAATQPPPAQTNYYRYSQVAQNGPQPLNTYAYNSNSYSNPREAATATSPSNESNASSSNAGSQSQQSGGSGAAGGAQNGGVPISSAAAAAAQQAAMANSQANGGGASSNASSAAGLGGGSEQLSKTNLYIRGLNPTTTDKDLVNMCQAYGNIISTKAILDKNTNKCKGYGFVDFENPAAAESAVKALTAKNVQAQMAKQQEQDPTNLYIANLPPNFKEADLDNMLSKYGQVISTRILRDTAGFSKGVGFARMESKERCEHIIHTMNGSHCPGSKDPLLVKFADGGNKKKIYKNNDNAKMWRQDDAMAVTYDPNVLTSNGVSPQHMMLQQFRGYNPQVFQYPYGYMIQQPLQMDESYSIPGHITPYKNDGQPPRAIPYVMPNAEPVQYPPNMMHQLTAQLGTMSLNSQYMNPGPYQYYPVVHAVPVDSEHTSNAGSPDDPYQSYQGGPQQK